MQKNFTLPANWRLTKLGEITEIVGGGTPDSKNKDYYCGEIAWITPADLSNYKSCYISRGAKNITELGLKKSSAKLLPKDTVCLSTRAPIGYVVIAENPLSTNQGFKNFLPSEKYFPKYLYWYFKGNKYLLESNASGTTFLELSKSRIEKIEIPLPPLAEQKRIVAVLDSLFEKLDAAKSIVQKISDGYELRRTAILHRAFTGELSAKWRVENNVTLHDWQEKTLGDLLSLSKEKTETFDAALKYVGLENIEKGVGEISFQSADTVKSTKNIFYKGDLLYGKLRPYLNKHGVANFDGVCSTDILVFNSNELSFNNFVNYFFNLPRFIEYAIANSKGINLPRVSAKEILNAPINLPPLEEQKEIARLLDHLLAKENRVKEIAEKTLQQIDALKKNILERAFRGELGTNNLEN